MTALDIIQHDGEFVVTSETIANGAGVEHRAVLQLIGNNIADFEEFGTVAFEMRPLPGGGLPVRVALLNEQQATLLMTFQRNTDQVRTFKKALVKAFFEIGKQVAPTGANLLALAVIEAQQMLEASARQVAELTPRAEAWDELASATGDYEVADAAKMLARAGVETGRQRLFGQLKGLGWIYRAPSGKWKARQSAVDAGYLAEKPQSHHHPRTGELVLDPPQVRVTVRGLERLRVRLGRVVALEVAS
ncbi:phage antirepressor KilAC domain-containing protein [Microbacterium maritypicum]